MFKKTIIILMIAVKFITLPGIAEAGQITGKYDEESFELGLELDPSDDLSLNAGFMQDLSSQNDYEDDEDDTSSILSTMSTTFDVSWKNMSASVEHVMDGSSTEVTLSGSQSLSSTQISLSQSYDIVQHMQKAHEYSIAKSFDNGLKLSAKDASYTGRDHQQTVTGSYANTQISHEFVHNTSVLAHAFTVGSHSIVPSVSHNHNTGETTYNVGFDVRF